MDFNLNTALFWVQDIPVFQPNSHYIRDFIPLLANTGNPSIAHLHLKPRSKLIIGASNV
jgi:hypothetical protein